MVSSEAFRTAMARFATGVTVVTTLDHDGEVHGMTANAFTSVCLEPAVLLVCIAHNTYTYGFVEARRCFGANIISADQEAIGRYFAKRPEERHGEVVYSCSKNESGIPLLDGSMVSFACRVMGSHQYGDHTLYVAEVDEMKLGDSADPLLFFESRWVTGPISGT